MFKRIFFVTVLKKFYITNYFQNVFKMTNYDHLPPIPTVYGITIMSFSLSFFIFLNSQIKLFSRSQKTLQPQNVESKTSKNSNGNGTSFHHNNNACTNSNIRQRMEASKEDGYISSDHLKNESNNHDSTHPPTSTSNHKGMCMKYK